MQLEQAQCKLQLAQQDTSAAESEAAEWQFKSLRTGLEYNMQQSFARQQDDAAAHLQAETLHCRHKTLPCTSSWQQHRQLSHSWRRPGRRMPNASVGTKMRWSANWRKSGPR
jgi:hypothetical protein